MAAIAAEGITTNAYAEREGLSVMTLCVRVASAFEAASSSRRPASLDGYGTDRHLATMCYLICGKLTRLPANPWLHARTALQAATST